jgi:hypothetical protein
MTRRVAQAVVMALLLCQSLAAQAQGTAFTYDGRLSVGGSPANGIYDIRAGLYTISTGGTVFAGPVTNPAVAVSNGLFTITLDYGNVFDGTTYWLQVAVRTNGVGSFTVLSPRQQLTPTPYAIFAEGANAAGLSGTVPSASLAGGYSGVVSFTNPANIFAGNGMGISNVNAVTLDGLNSGNFWQLGGNAGTSPTVNFLGTTDNNALQLRSFNEPGLQLQYVSSGTVLTGLEYGMNVVAGYWGNSISSGTVGGTIAGGGDSFRFDVISGDNPNRILADFGTIGGGLGNTAGEYATIPGGSGNTVTGIGSFGAGQDVRTVNNGTFMWGDGSQNPFTGAGVDNAFNVLASGGVFFYDGTNGVHVDGMGNNNGTIDFGLKFGGALSSGEGIASKRTAGGNQYGLDFYTSSNDRMSIAANGFVGINTTSPSQRLEVAGNYVLIDGHNADNGNGPIDAYIGGNGSGSDVQIGSMNSLITAVGFWNTAAGAWMHIACSSITINGGADVAEPFPLTTAAEEIIAGSVVVIDEENPGRLKLSAGAYDSHVAGVVSGANGVHPGIQMQQQGLLEGGRNVALTGRVYVQADASNGAIKPGDLLTTSSRPGHAMKVTDHARAQGAILGKAMTGLSEGDGLVLVLVTLQ